MKRDFWRMLSGTLESWTEAGRGTTIARAKQAVVKPEKPPRMPDVKVTGLQRCRTLQNETVRIWERSSCEDFGSKYDGNRGRWVS